MRRNGVGWAIEPCGEYPANWDQIANELKAQAGWQCEECKSLFFPHTNLAIYDVCTNGRPVVLTIHHLSGDKADCTFQNCLVCCQRCHLRIQREWGPGDPLPPRWEVAPEWMVKRGLAYSPRQQLPLL